MSTVFRTVATVMVLAGWVQAQDLDSLRQSYDKQAQALLNSYSNSLTSVAGELKKKGNLDAYLVVEAEQKRFSADKTVPVPKDASDVFRSVSEGYYRATTVLLRRYIEAMDGLVKRSLQADKVDDAKAAKSTKEAVEFTLADIESKMPKPEPSKLVDIRQKNVAALMGSWDVTNPQNKYRGTWIFKEDGTVISSTSNPGKWTMEERQVLIVWGEKAWDTFALPLSNSVRGDSWTGKGAIKAVKN